MTFAYYACIRRHARTACSSGGCQHKSRTCSCELRSGFSSVSTLTMRMLSPMVSYTCATDTAPTGPCPGRLTFKGHHRVRRCHLLQLLGQQQAWSAPGGKEAAHVDCLSSSVSGNQVLSRHGMASELDDGCKDRYRQEESTLDDEGLGALLDCHLKLLSIQLLNLLVNVHIQLT